VLVHGDRYAAGFRQSGNDLWQIGLQVKANPAVERRVFRERCWLGGEEPTGQQQWE
jgi:hypothetical protein